MDGNTTKRSSMPSHCSLKLLFSATMQLNLSLMAKRNGLWIELAHYPLFCLNPLDLSRRIEYLELSGQPGVRQSPAHASRFRNRLSPAGCSRTITFWNAALSASGLVKSEPCRLIDSRLFGTAGFDLFLERPHR